MPSHHCPQAPSHHGIQAPDCHPAQAPCHRCTHNHCHAQAPCCRCAQVYHAQASYHLHDLGTLPLSDQPSTIHCSLLVSITAICRWHQDILWFPSHCPHPQPLSTPRCSKTTLFVVCFQVYQFSLCSCCGYVCFSVGQIFNQVFHQFYGSFLDCSFFNSFSVLIVKVAAHA